jgi:hypothetical protein
MTTMCHAIELCKTSWSSIKTPPMSDLLLPYNTPKNRHFSIKDTFQF